MRFKHDPTNDTTLDHQRQQIGPLFELTASWKATLAEGRSLQLTDQRDAVSLAEEAAKAFLASNFCERVRVAADLQRHFSSMHTLAPFDQPEILRRLSSLIAVGRRLSGWVISIDVRDSTEMMLHSAPADFARFMSTLAEWLKHDLTYPHGFFDKFTGDGAIGFFPDELTDNSGELAVLDAAFASHACFYNLYCNHFSKVFPRGPASGLGVGIAYGEVEMVAVAGTPTIVGEPVVWACRLSNGIDETKMLSDAHQIIVTSFEGLREHFESRQEEVKSKRGKTDVWLWDGKLSDYPLPAPSWCKDRAATAYLQRSTPIVDGSCEFFQPEGRCARIVESGRRYCTEHAREMGPRATATLPMSEMRRRRAPTGLGPTKPI